MGKGCLFHGERIYFEDVKKALRRARLIPRTLTSCLAMAVCSCRKKVPALPCSENEMSDIVQYFRDNSQNVTTEPGLALIIQRIVNYDDRSVDKSYLKLLYLIYQASKEDFTLLTNEQKFTSDAPKKFVRRRRPIKVTPHTAFMILKKKMSRMAIKQKLLIPMFPGSMKLLYEKTGVNFCKFSKEYGCVVRLNNDANTHNIERKIARTSVTVGCSDEKTFKTIQQKLSEFAGDIQRDNDIKWRTTIEMRKHLKNIRKQHWLEREAEEHRKTTGMEKLGIDSLDFKEINCYNGERKRSNENRHRGKKSRKPYQTLLGGHCLYCLKPYSRGPGDQLSDSCIYHPGFIRYTLCGWTWSCCDERGTEYPTHKDHSDTGCRTSSHEWKAHKKANRKPELWKHSQIVDFPLSKINTSNCFSASDAVLEVDSFYLESYR